MKNKVSKALQETVANNPHIEHVHFDTKGNHWLNVHQFKADSAAIKKDKDASKANGLYGRIDVKTVQDTASAKTFDILTPIASTKIVETVDREDILDAETTSDLTLSAALMQGLSPEQNAEIRRILAGGKPAPATAVVEK